MMAGSHRCFQVVFYIILAGGKVSNNSLPRQNVDRETTEMLPVHTSTQKLHNSLFGKTEPLSNPDITKSDSAMGENKVVEEDSLIPVYPSTEVTSGTSNVDGTPGRAHDGARGGIIKTVMETFTFNYTDFTVSMPTSTYIPDPNCVGVRVDLIRDIVYCTDAFGNVYISSPAEDTTMPMSSPEQTQDVSGLLQVTDSSANTTLSASSYRLAFQTWCPNSVFCPEENEPITSSNPCCIRCDCSDTCVTSGTCCLDKNHAHASESDITTSSKISHAHEVDRETTTNQNDPQTNEREAKSRTTERCVQTYKGALSSHIKISSTHTFMLIQACPEEDRIENKALNKCIQPNETNLDELVPFYSTHTGRNYRNIYCAKCNNDTLFGRHWDSYFSCPTEVVTLYLSRTIQDVNGIVPVSSLSTVDGCLLHWEPASNETKYCVDQSTIISSCQNSELDGSCPQNHAPVRGRKGLYRNLFCLFCNEEGTELVCDDKREEQNVFVTKLPIGELLLHANTREMAPGTETNVHVNCEIGLVYDHDINECIQKTCAITQMKIGEKCFSVMEHTSGLGLDYRLTVSLPPASIPTTDDILDITRAVSLLPNDDGNCIEKVLGIEERDSGVKVQVQLIKTVKTLSDIQTHFRAFEEQVSQLNKRATEVKAPIKVDIAKPPLAPVSEKLISLVVFSDNSNHTVDCGRTIAMSDIQFCESVLLQDVFVYSNGTVRYMNVTFAPGEYVARTDNKTLHTSGVFINGERKTTADSVSVCYDLYVVRVLESLPNTTPDTDVNVMSGVASDPLSGPVFHVMIEVIVLLIYRHS